MHLCDILDGDVGFGGDLQVVLWVRVDDDQHWVRRVLANQLVQVCSNQAPMIFIIIRSRSKDKTKMIDLRK